MRAKVTDVRLRTVIGAADDKREKGENMTEVYY